MSKRTTETAAFNGLTPAEAERLALLAEECGEVIQAIGKVLRHGYNSRSPLPGSDVRCNRLLLEDELGQVTAAVTLMVNAGDLFQSYIHQATEVKLSSVQRWLHHQSCSSDGKNT